MTPLPVRGSNDEWEEKAAEGVGPGSWNTYHYPWRWRMIVARLLEFSRSMLGIDLYPEHVTVLPRDHSRASLDTKRKVNCCSWDQLETASGPAGSQPRDSHP
eukprot:3031177-Rhodomonas_salina.1